MSYVRIKEFVPEIMLRPRSADDADGVKILVIGRPGSGKSHVVKAFLRAKRHLLPCAIAFSGTEIATSHWGKVIPPTFVFDGLDTVTLERALERQAALINSESHVNPWLAVVLDDVTDDKQVLRQPVFKTIFKNGRHYRLFFIMTMQFVKDIPADLRSNADYVVLFKEQSLLSKKKLFEDFGAMCGDFSTFCNVMDSVTGNHSCLVIDNTRHSESYEDNMYWYKAPENSPFVLGSEDYWRFHCTRHKTI